MRSREKKAYIEKARDYFPEIRFEDTQLIKSGWDHDVLVLDDRYVFRFPKKDLPTKYRAKFRAEVQLLAYLAPRVSIEVPQYHYTPPDLSFGGYTIIPGAKIHPESFARLADGRKEEIARQLGVFLSVMHATPVALAKEFGFDEEEGGYWWGREHTERTFNSLREKVFPKLSVSEVSWIERQFEKYLSLSFDIDLTVIHSDFSHDHIFFDPNRGFVTGVIDFGDTELSDPALDFAGMWHYGSAFPEQVLAHYTGKTDKDFLKRSKFPALMQALSR